MENFFQVPAYAKINLYLRVLGKRPDGYHELETVFQTISLHDTLTFSPDHKLELTCDDPEMPTGDENLIVRAANALRERFHVKQGARIHLEKRIPSPGGLGGGSSDAATALVGLARLWDLKIDFETVSAVGAKLGADVPFFFFGGTACGTGVGTEISPLPDFRQEFILIVTPPVAVSTAAAYRELKAPRLTNGASKSILKICRNSSERPNLQQLSLENDFEAVIFKIYPEIKSAKDELLAAGAGKALLSGSGGSVFGIFDNEKRRQTAIERIAAQRDWRVFAVSTVSRGEYRKNLQSGGGLLPAVL